MHWFSVCRHAIAITPVGPHSLVGSRLPLLGQETCTTQRRPSPLFRRVGSHITLFEACSAFTRVTACLLAESPSDPLPSKASTVSSPPLPLRLLPAGVTSCRVGLTPTKNQHLFTAHVESRCGAERIRFRTPLIEPDGRFSRIRLSDKEGDLAVFMLSPTGGWFSLRCSMQRRQQLLNRIQSW